MSGIASKSFSNPVASLCIVTLLEIKSNNALVSLCVMVNECVIANPLQILDTKIGTNSSKLKQNAVCKSLLVLNLLFECHLKDLPFRLHG